MDKTRILVKVRGDGSAFASTAPSGIAASDIQPIMSVSRSSTTGGAAMGPASAAASATWLRVDASNLADHPWNAAHRLLQDANDRGLSTRTGVVSVEPDIEQQWLTGPLETGDATPFPAGNTCAFHDQDGSGRRARGPAPAWNRDDVYSTFKQAIDYFGGALESKLREVVIAHLDTGYDAAHVTRPIHLLTELQRNFVDADRQGDATDRAQPGGGPLNNRGHGAATIALLAGNRLDGSSPGWPDFKDFIGGAPYASVIPVRIADWVVRFSTSTMVQGIEHARINNAQVLSMSMGGLTSQALVDAINAAYDAGMVLVTAAGNNFAWRPTPKTIVFPARYRRVLAACGVMADGSAYADLESGTMQGNYGPASKMATALGAYTPNVPWASFGCGKVVDMDGAGTSAATPQIAAAAALWLAAHHTEVAAYPEPWMRVEAVRRALFDAAAKSTNSMGPAETREKIGQGVLKAHAALRSMPSPPKSLERTPPAVASWGWVNLLFGGEITVAPGIDPTRARMLALELTQMAQHSRAVEDAIADNDLPASQVSVTARRRYLEAALDAGNPSQPLKRVLEEMLSREQSSSAPTTSKTAPQPKIHRKPKAVPTPKRRLRVYALDPSIAKSLDSVQVNETVLSIPWEETLSAGPVGEYLEVVDIDPASGKLYDPVDLNKPTLLAQDGWPPSEGNPEFHQQMAYAVAMTTIGHFEEALGRKALWAPRRVIWKSEDGVWHQDVHEVRRLRIYPHALRTDNAYYSPDKVALLFGYFQARTRENDPTASGSMVFSCLSSDIIAHEMSHALLDGLHRRLQEASNPDVPAFHEGFADIVALFQHFTIPELVRFQIAKAGGRLDAARFLGSLAQQFGEGTSRGGPLRDYLSSETQKIDYATTKEVHARGSILVYAVYQAFLKIVDHRTADLVRIATNGTGVLPQGALHPDLVNRLADEACKTAKHALRMCIRALDYCPAVDITFGEYLRALITSDMDLVPEDRYNYRVAFMDAFRAQNILPRDVKTVSSESLAWGGFAGPTQWIDDVVESLDFRWDRALDRSEIFELNNKNRWSMWRALTRAFAQDPELCTQFGLMRGIPRYKPDGTVHKEAVPGGTTFEVFSVRPARRVAPDGSFRIEVIATIQQRRAMWIDEKNHDAGWFWFRGGATLLLDPREGQRGVRYSIIKNMSSEQRLARQRRMLTAGFAEPLRALYFGDAIEEPFAILHANKGGLCHG